MIILPARFVTLVLTLVTLTALGIRLQQSISARQATTAAAVQGHAAASGGDGEFDFLIGDWKVRHRRLTEILEGSSDWYEFDGTLSARKLWQGRGHIDEFRGDGPRGPVDGMSIRIFDPSSRQWRDYYTSAAARAFDPPLVGRFQGDRAEFYGHELYKGRSVYVRQIWTRLTASSCRWEQAFSADGGRTWETNWIMDLTR